MTWFRGSLIFLLYLLPFNEAVLAQTLLERQANANLKLGGTFLGKDPQRAISYLHKADSLFKQNKNPEGRLNSLLILVLDKYLIFHLAIMRIKIFDNL